MQLPQDMKRYAAEPDALLIPAHTAGWIVLTAVVLAMILEPIFRRFA